jgi:hypothetical protein
VFKNGGLIKTSPEQQSLRELTTNGFEVNELLKDIIQEEEKLFQ